MKVSLISLATIAAVSTLIQPASAQNARFEFAPNVYAGEQPNKPRHSYQVQAPYVPQGAVPKNMLGIDPGFISKAPPPPVRQIVVPRIAPIAQTSTQATPSFTSAVPKSVPQPLPLPPAFQARFGNPISTPPVVAMQPKAPTGLTAPAKSDAAKPSSKPAAHRIAYSSNFLHGTIHPHVQTGQSANANRLPTVATYAPNVGYRSGQLLPSVGNNGGSGASATVAGTLLSQQRRHH
ncbi:MAG TPA: hypothetical protein V6C69_05010 [Trichormus sp.]|jgi:hypothetical protein